MQIGIGWACLVANLHMTITNEFNNYIRRRRHLLHLTDCCTNHRIPSHSQDAETHDHQDHTFSGIMFPILARSDGPPIDYLEISTVWVRGSLGPLTVWVTSGTWVGKHEEEHLWTKVHESEQPPSFRKLGRSACPPPSSQQSFPLSRRAVTSSRLLVKKKTLPTTPGGRDSAPPPPPPPLPPPPPPPPPQAPLALDPPLRIKPGDQVSVYVHSSAFGDRAIVYDNQRAAVTHEDEHVRLLPGLAHLSRCGTCVQLL